MPEPKSPKKRTFEAQSESPAAGLRLAPQRTERTEAERNTAASEIGPCPGEIQPPEPELVTKLIRFLKNF